MCRQQTYNDLGGTEMSAEQQNQDSAFDVLDVDMEEGTVTVRIKKGIIGPMANQLKSTTNQRKGATIVRKLGFVLSEAGDRLYGDAVEDGELQDVTH